MLLYSYDQNGFYQGSFEAQENPMAHLEGESAYLIAAHSTPIAPSEESSGLEINRFVDGQWELVEDPSIPEKLNLANESGTKLFEIKDGVLQARPVEDIAVDDEAYQQSVLAEQAANEAKALSDAEEKTARLLIVQSAFQKIKVLCELTDEEFNAVLESFAK